jgi:hypothetical protein
MTRINFALSREEVDVFDFVEITAFVQEGAAVNPFTEMECFGVFGLDDKSLVPVDGFCDAPDGSIYRIRFMPVSAGTYQYRVTLKGPGGSWQQQGTFAAHDAGRRGLVRVDPEHPFHFTWQGTGEHYFYNSTTTYSILGLKEPVMLQAAARLHRLGVNRLRVSLGSARVKDGMVWFEPVYPSEDFTFAFGPWEARQPENMENPGWDVARFNIAHWQKMERLVDFARQRDMVISVIFYLDGMRPGATPFGLDVMGSLDEQRYYRYAAARLGAYSNVMWDVSNEYQLFRSDAWAERMGSFLKACDPYNHLTSVHGQATFNFSRSGWADFAMYQIWDEQGGYTCMLDKRRQHEQMGRPMPQVNEEYGYEDHYPQGWDQSRVRPARSTANRCRLAWEMTMAGTYQTAGEYAGNGLGGWVNGRGDDSMTMLESYRHLMEFFTSFEWWRTEPHPELVSGNAYCLAEPGRIYALYLPEGGRMEAALEPGVYQVTWFNPQTGEFLPAKELTHAGGVCALAAPGWQGDAAVKMIARG